MTIMVGNKECLEQAELDTRSSVTAILETLGKELGCDIILAIRKVKTVIQSLTLKCLGTMHITLSTTQHHIECLAEVFPSKMTPCILISQDLLAKYGLHSFESTLLNPIGENLI